MHPIIPPTIAPAEAWQMVRDQLQMNMNRDFFNAFVRDARVADFDGECLTILVPDAHARDWLASRLTKTVERQLSPLFGYEIKASFVYSSIEDQEEAVAQAVIEEETAAEAPSASPQAEFLPETGHGEMEIPASGQGRGEQTAPAVVTSTPVVIPTALVEMQSLAESDCQTIRIEEIAGTVEAALQQPGKIVAFPRYELRHIALVGPEAFFLRLAFLQERFLHTTPEGRAKPFETSVDALLRWANVGRATLHRFKKGDPARGQTAAAGWFGIEQLPSPPRSADAQRQPPCRYRIQQGIPLTPMDADRLHGLLREAGIQRDPLGALEELCARPLHELLQFPAPAPNEEQRRRAPVYTTVASVVQSALSGTRLDADLRARVQDAAARLSDHITMPQQMVHVSWYFLQNWLPILGHDAAALVLYARAQGYYNPQKQELRDEITVTGGYSELARAIGLKRDRTIGDWLPNIFDRQADKRASADARWQREQERQQELQERIARFVQVIPGSRRKMPEGHYAFNLHVEIQGEPLTVADQTVRDWVYQTLAACLEQQVLEHFQAWVSAPVIGRLAGLGEKIDNDGAGTLGADAQNDAWGPQSTKNDVWGILAAREMTGGESGSLKIDGWGILESILNDGLGILARSQMTARELFKRLLKLNTFWESIPQIITSTREAQNPAVVVAPTQDAWDLRKICQRNGGMNAFREQLLARENSAEPFLSWLIYAYSIKGRGIEDPVGWALTRLRDQPKAQAEGVFSELAAYPPSDFGRQLFRQIETGQAADERWSAVFRDVPAPRLRALADTLGLVGQGASLD